MKSIAGILARLNISAKIATAATSLFIENCAEAFLRLFAWIAFFICLWVAGYTSHIIAIVFWIGTTLLYLLGLSRLIIPTRKDILHRVELASKLKHRPLSSLNDNRTTSGSEELWELEKARQKSLLKNLRHSRPDAQMSRRDPYALRIVFVLLLVCALFIMPADIWPRIKSGITLSGKDEGATASIPFAQVRITPPAYSGLKILALTDTSKPIEILKGSRIQADVQTAWGNPRLKMNETDIALKRKENTDVWTVDAIIPQTDFLKITMYGIPRFNQKVIWHEDTPPIIGWSGDIETLPTGELRIPLKIADDFGIVKLSLRAILTPDEKTPAFGSPLLIEKKMNLPIRGSTEIKPTFDATGHVWAGKRASIIVEAEDFAGNVSETAPLDITLPVRNFRNPVSKHLARVRSDLLNLRGTVSDIVADIETILFNPDLYKWDTVVTLGLRSIDSRLHYARDKTALESSASMMWSLAMRLEDGRISETQTSLKQALEKLQEAIQKGANKAELAELMQQVQQALLQHLQTMARQMQQNTQMPQMQPGQNTLNMGELSNFLQKLQEDLAKGNTNSAQQMLNQLQQLADMLGGSAAQGMPKDMQDMMQNLQDLQNLIARQKKNLDKTRESKSEDTPSLSQEQKDIEQQTGDMSGKVQNSKPLNDAKGEMSQSASDLDGGDMPSSAAHQQKALDHLTSAAQSMQKQLQEKMQNMMGLSFGQSGPEDPLGRSQQILRDDGTRIPEGAAGKKTDAIIKTLRERAGDMKRPLEERNYYQRLLKQW